MQISDSIANFIDRAVAVVSPRRALARRIYRERLAGPGDPEILSFFKRAETYTAARPGRLSGSPYSLVSSNVNDIIAASSPALRARIRELIRDFPYLARAVNVLVDYTVGQGIVYQSQVRDENGKLDKKINQQIEDHLAWWMDESDAAGRLHYFDQMRLEKRQDCEIGELLVVKDYSRRPNQYINYSLQSYESDWLTSTRDSYGAGGIGMPASSGARETRQGVEYEKATGRVTGYWFLDPHYGGQDVYVRADQVVHGFDMLRPQQLRGVSAFAVGVLIANDLNSYLNAEIDAAKMAAKWLAKVKRQNPSAMQGLPGYERTTDAAGNAATVETLENCIIEYIREGEDVEIMKNERPGQTFSPTVRLLLTMLSVSTGAPYELISGDYQGMNFSTAQIVRSDFSQALRPIAARHIRQFCIPTLRTAIEIGVLSGKLDLKGFWQNPRHYLVGEWQPPGMEAINPLREAKGQVEAIDGLLQSPQEVSRKRGRNYEDILDEIQYAREMQADRGLSPRDARKSEKNNPAAIAGGQTDEEA